MHPFEMPGLSIGHKSAPLPIVQGGMGVGISLAGLAAAVAAEGGVGVIAANAIGMIDPSYASDGRRANIRALRSEIRKARQESRGLIGVNVMVALNDFQDMLKVVIEERPDVVFLGAGLPIKGIPVEELRRSEVMVAPIVSSGRATRVIFRAWKKIYGDVPDAVVVEGPLAGGHLGFKAEEIDSEAHTLERIVPEVLEELAGFEREFRRPIPVIAGGGVYDGDDIERLFELGASGIQMGTRFVVTHECDACQGFKDAFIDCEKSDLVIIKSPVGMLGRAIRNKFLDDAQAGRLKRRKCPWRCLESCNLKDAGYCISIALDNARLGNLDDGYAFAGANAYRTDRLMSVRELVDSLRFEYSAAVERGVVAVRRDYDSFLGRVMSVKNEYVASFGELVEEYEQLFEERVNDMKQSYTRRVGSFKETYDTSMDRLKVSYNEKLTGMKDEYTTFLDRVDALRRTVPEKARELVLPLGFFSTSALD